MTWAELEEEIALEFVFMESTVQELLALERDVGKNEPSIRERTAGAAFLAQFYSGIENILKRISRFCGVALPTGDMWHVGRATPAVFVPWP